MDVFWGEHIVFRIRPLLERSYREELNQEEALGTAVGKKDNQEGYFFLK